jgi:hypothetical protein
MKAVRFDNYSDIDVLRVADVAMPEPVHGEVKVKAGIAFMRKDEMCALPWRVPWPCAKALNLVHLCLH